MNTLIKVENLSKQYRLGQIGTITLKDDVIKWWNKFIKKDLSLNESIEVNDRTSVSSSKFVWSLKNINFEINQGEVIGIIGKNGAGKSTLLKLLSRITAPTNGKIKIKGKVASLLEVGTGFHPELTGKENIFLNGAILGMSKKEITNNFDAIVKFAGVEKYINTPVKRYSSGMYVRLAFAVAAHLDSDILIVDEVLAVGDSDFQKKCLGKMKDISSNSGKTVLFVSHNMDSISRLCDRVLYLKNGEFVNFGPTSVIIEQYLNEESSATNEKNYFASDTIKGNEIVKLIQVKVIDELNFTRYNFSVDEKIGLIVKFQVLEETSDLICGINVFNNMDVHLFSSHDTVNYKKVYSPGIYEVKVYIPENLFNEGVHYCGIAFMSYYPFTIHLNDVGSIGFNIIDKQDGSTNRGFYTNTIPGALRPSLNWVKI